MRAFVIGVGIVVALSLSACGDDDASNEQPPSPDPTTEASLGVDVPDIVGDSVEDATATLEEAGLTLRVVRRDGEDLPATMDFVPTRVNVAVETERYGGEVVTEVVSVG